MHISFQIPNQKNILKAANELQKTQISEKKLALYSQWCRFDARLSEIWISHFYKNHQLFNLQLLYNEIHKQPWPAATICLLEFVPQLAKRNEQKILKNILRFLSFEVKPAQGEIFYFEMTKMKPQWQLQEVINGIKSFSKWGYWCQEIPINKLNLKNRSTTFRSKQKRQAVLSKLIEDFVAHSKTITVQDYLRALGGTVSKRIAQMDLQHSSSLEPIGQTRNRKYVIRKT